MAQGSHQNIDDLGAVAEAHADLPVEPATPPPGIEGAGMVEQLREMQAIMKQLQQENERFKFLFTGDKYEAMPEQKPEEMPEHVYLTPKKSAPPQAETPTPWKQGWGDPWWRSRPDPWTYSKSASPPDPSGGWKSASPPEPEPSGDWQKQPWCQPASQQMTGEWQRQPWCQPASQHQTAWTTTPQSWEWPQAGRNQWHGSGWGWASYCANGWNDLKESNSYYANGWNDLKEIHHQDMRAPDTYNGDITLWKAWSKAFERYLRRRDPRWPSLLEKVQELKGKPVTEEDEKKWAGELGIYNMAQFKHHLIQYLEAFTDKDAKGIVNACGERNALDAWRQLAERGFSLRPSHVHELIRSAVFPRVAVQPRELEMAIATWEKGVQIYENKVTKHFVEVFSKIIKIFW